MLSFIKANTQKFSEKVQQTIQDVQIQKYIENVQKFIDDDDDGAYEQPIDLEEQKMTMSEKLQLIVNKSSLLTDKEKQFIFQYAKSNPQAVHTGESMDRFAKNLIIVINQFFEYGFTEQSESSKKQVEHYWELISEYFNNYSSVSYIKQQMGSTQKSPEYSLSWITLVLNEENVLYYCFHEIFSNQYFLSHYDQKLSFFHNNREELLEVSKSIYQHKLMINSKFNQKYQDYLKESLKLRMQQNLGFVPRSSDADNKLQNYLDQYEKEQSLQNSQNNDAEELMFDKQDTNDIDQNNLYEKQLLDSNSDQDYIKDREQLFNQVISEDSENQDSSIDLIQNPINDANQNVILIEQKAISHQRRMSIQDEISYEDDMFKGGSPIRKETLQQQPNSVRLHLFSKVEIVSKSSIKRQELPLISPSFQRFQQEISMSNIEPIKQQNANIFNSNQQYFSGLSQFTSGLNQYQDQYEQNDQWIYDKQEQIPLSNVKGDYSNFHKNIRNISPIERIEEQEDGSLQRQSSLLKVINQKQISPMKLQLHKVRRTEVNQRDFRSIDSDAQNLLGSQNYDKQNFIVKTQRKKERKYDRTTMRLTTASSISPRAPQNIELKNSDIVYFNEFLSILKRKEYNSFEVHKFLKKITNRFNNKSMCHQCGKNMDNFMTKYIKRCFCFFCMENVCSKECLNDAKFMIPRLFNLQFDLEQKPVCKLSAMFLNRRVYVKIQNSHPQVAIQDSLYMFMVHRRKFHKIFDSLKCEAWMNIVEKNGFASEKNLVLKDFYLTLQQLAQFKTGELKQKLKHMSQLLLGHLKQCQECNIQKVTCMECDQAPLFYEFDIEIAGECQFCQIKAHLNCLRKHQCNKYQDIGN